MRVLERVALHALPATTCCWCASGGEETRRGLALNAASSFRALQQISLYFPPFIALAGQQVAAFSPIPRHSSNSMLASQNLLPRAEETHKDSDRNVGGAFRLTFSSFPSSSELFRPL